MRARMLGVAGVIVLTLAGCVSAADIEGEAGDRQAQSQKGQPSASASPQPSGSPTPSDVPAQTAEPPASVQPTPATPSPRARLRLPNSVGRVGQFLTPSRNIGCVLTVDLVRCDINEYEYAAPDPPADCPGDYGQSVAVDPSGVAEYVCVTDTVIDPAAPVLEYGTSAVVGDFGCTSTEESINCYHLEGKHGFKLSRDGPALF